MTRERRIFLLGVAALVVIDIGGLGTLVYWTHPSWAPEVFFIEIFAAAALTSWHERARKRAPNR